MSTPNQNSPQAPRPDLYGPVHKGLRREMCSLLARLGSADSSNEQQTTELLRDLRGILDLCSHHMETENKFLHPAVEQRAKGGAAKQSHEHEEHAKEIAQLRAQATELEKATGPARKAAAHKLYLSYGGFVGENLVHMADEEHGLQSQLHAHYTDQELRAIEGEVLRSMKPDVMMAFLKGMIPAMNRDERVGLLGGMKLGAPPEAFNGVIQGIARPNLSEADFKDLTQRLGIPG